MTADIGRLCTEILDVLVDVYFLRQAVPDSDNALDNMRTMAFAHLLHNDIVLRLWKFRDKDDGSLSFAKALEGIRGTADPKRVAEISTDIARYTTKTINLQTYRHKHVAHLAVHQERVVLPLKIRDCIRLALQITDALSGESNRYRLLVVGQFEIG